MPLSDEILTARLLAWIADAAREDFNPMLLAVHEFQKSANPDYARYCATFPPATHWSEIPALPQQIFKYQAVRCFAAEITLRTFRTSGTTGETFGEHHFKSLAIYEAAARTGWELAGLPATGIFSLIPPASEAPFSSLSQMASWLTDDEAFFMRGGEGRWDELADRLDAANQPVTLFGTALAFLDFFEWLGSRSFPLPAGCLAVETGGYKGTRRELPKAALYAQFTERLGLEPDSIFNEYGMTELSSQFFARGLGTPHTGPHWARGLVIDPETSQEVTDGEIGVLRMVDAANLWSVCAVQTQDLAIRRGVDFELIGRDPTALPRGCSRMVDEMLTTRPA